MKPVIGIVAALLDGVHIEPAGPPMTYLGVAEAMLPGLRVLASPPTASPMALCLVAAHILECLLKASLTRRQSNEQAKAAAEKEVMEAGNRHNLDWLWREAVQRGLAISLAPPAWVQRLAEVHGKPFYLRYSTDIHAVVLPAAEPMATELATLASLVRDQVTQ